MDPANAFNMLTAQTDSAGELATCAEIYKYLANAIDNVRNCQPPANWKYSDAWNSAVQMHIGEKRAFEQLSAEMSFALAFWFCIYH